jgi:hypothetical protein
MSVLSGGPFEGREVAGMATADLEAAKVWAIRALKQAQREENAGLAAQHSNDLVQLDAERVRRWEHVTSEQPLAGTPRQLGTRAGFPPTAAPSASLRSVEPMMALTVWQPWAWAIAEGFKLVENRDWKPAPKLLSPGQRLAIHAAVRAVDREALMSVREALFRSRGRADGALPWEVPPADSKAYVLGGIVAVATYRGHVTLRRELPLAQQPWFVGDFGWLLEGVVKLRQPVPARGQQGLWALPGEVLFAVDAQLRGGGR